MAFLFGILLIINLLLIAYKAFEYYAEEDP